MDSYLPEFLELINEADYVVGHNIPFDANMII
jgi:DNA polymerase III epsilon subunit-like protein